MSLQVFREAYTRDGGNVSFGEQYTSASLSAGQVTPWFNLTPKNGKPCVLGVIFKAIYVLTATAPETPVSGSDALDPILSGSNGAEVDIAPSAGAAGRAQSLTRAFAEFLYAALTNTSFSIAALPTFASAGTSTITVSWFVPVGGQAAAVRIKLPSSITASYAAGVTVSYTSITSEIVSTTFSGVCAFREEKTASLGSGYQSILAYVPKDVAPDAAFLAAESSTTITQVQIATTAGGMIVNSSDTDALQLGAAAFAPIAGATYTTTAGFVLTLDGSSFTQFSVNFASATTHYIGFVQVQGGSTTLENISPMATQATPAVTQTGSVTASGQVAAKPGSTGAPSATRGGGRHVYKSRSS